MRRLFTGGQGGFTYMTVLVFLMVTGIMSAVVVQTWKSVSRIEKERELIWRGHQFRNAIKFYYEYRKKLHSGAPGNYYPQDLKDLLHDPAIARDQSWLRKIYVDPMTGKDDWVLIRTTGGIKGVRSASDAEPLRKAGFDVDDSSFTGKTRYSEWVFEYPTIVRYTGAPVPNYVTYLPPAGGGPGGTGGAGGTGGTGGAGGAGGTGGSTGWPAETPGSTGNW